MEQDESDIRSLNIPSVANRSAVRASFQQVAAIARQLERGWKLSCDRGGFILRAELV